ncbi:hypothetical protein [Spirosoma endophyticum]|uniref:Uncharacterized protein n=1 Tax=Spirosoma endophyticum TaxID=662367 RepID=A0A1I1XMP6_9BACT|nr:hypothetical protein [Spirosoma endophyticum]SFE07898.1 hypothetical protein SAMN05216167_11036 [Spirosoma endophyticum]
MKPIYYLTLSILCSGMIACKSNSPQPDETGLSGTWVMFQRQPREVSTDSPKPFPSSSQQTITFTYPHQLSTDVVDDSTLAMATYFQIAGGTGIVGPYLLVKKNADSVTGHTFYYNFSGKADTLRLFEFGQPKGYQYGFRRL